MGKKVKQFLAFFYVKSGSNTKSTDQYSYEEKLNSKIVVCVPVRVSCSLILSFETTINVDGFGSLSVIMYCKSNWSKSCQEISTQAFLVGSCLIVTLY